MPGKRLHKLAQLPVAQAFGMDELHSQLQKMYAESFTDPAYWRGLMAPAVMPMVQAAQDMGTDRDPATWAGDMARKGLPGTENDPNYVEPTVPPAPHGSVEHEVGFAQDLNSALNQNITRLVKQR